ncbi:MULTISPECIES: AraC family transcriptional regulator [unclassified Lysobacter]|jgi:AraC-like DNA-binding protein|uniref:AraC family transcriptional regulator n=2 Tax=Lysobacter TaxID=68 RepID=UPI001BE86061|nr:MULTISPECIES: AraC family transcriptional regulator [unclassified Lysobacter]MBT2746013.1 AraC family transcriptional regulator [Lysobacter sp. ISL-42]MBT2752448.1 AraC family transcriptional regulator [Lysobacter sp. ISL-50]MBT2776823.1 AraC family transcriptional regulator [Lysobacter sp. ISL-54]MBT2780609.1 AraC family transcriptional regulator [Lysobacter sp. ISL-52]
MNANTSAESIAHRGSCAAQAELVDRIARLTDGGGDGVHSTVVRPLHLIRMSGPTECSPSVYEPRLCVVAQGRKVVTLSDRTYHYDPLNYLVVSVTLPMIGQIVEATPDKPYLCLRIDIDPAEIARLIVDAGQSPASDTGRESNGVDLGLYAAKVNKTLMDAVLRLMRLLDTPQDLPVLAPMALREIFYRVLMGDLGHRLRALAVTDSRSSRVAKAVAVLRQRYLQPLCIEDLADEVHMSTSSLHHQFKAVTTMSPLQFQKHLRLHEARRLMMVGGIEAVAAAHRVGYESPSQFSREYKRLFGAPPRSEVVLARGAPQG